MSEGEILILRYFTFDFTDECKVIRERNAADHKVVYANMTDGMSFKF